MDVFDAKNELRRMSRRDLLIVALNQRMSRCLISGRTCGFYFNYKRFNFCVSEILGESCLVERLTKMEERHQQAGEIICPLPLIEKSEKIVLPPAERTVEFKVYWRDNLTRSTILLGKVIERRAKERGNNLKDLLGRAMKDYSDSVADPSMIFLLGS